MTQVILTQANYLLSPISYVVLAILSFFSRMGEASTRRRIIRETENQLIKLSDYELSDIGLTRGDIYHIARSRPPVATVVNCKQKYTNTNLKGWV